jgi:Fe-Mn family superoxide dismutase
MAFELPALPYSKDALQPYMSAETLEFHHGKHHQAYVDALNKLVPGSALDGKSLDEIVMESAGKPDMQAIFNNAGQHWNHTNFWKWMKPDGGGAIPGEVEKRLVADFGSVDKFKEDFATNGVGQFGSGWVWLVSDGNKLSIMKTPNGDNPLAHGSHALLGCDVWEHSYYIDYRNKRADYLKAFVNNLVNWDYVAELLAKH